MGSSGRRWGSRYTKRWDTRECWGKSSEDLATGQPVSWTWQWEVPTPPLSLEDTLSAIPTVGAIFQNAALRERRGVGTIWTDYLTEPHSGLYIPLKVLGQYGDLCPRQTSSLAYSILLLPMEWLPLSAVALCPACTRAGL